MWQDAGLLRDASGLRAMLLELEETAEQGVAAATRESLELANLHTVAALIVRSALKREESRGAHYRNDFPRREDAHFAKHSVVRRRAVSFEAAEQVTLAR
jgi:L-aspartate oxidase